VAVIIRGSGMVGGETSENVNLRRFARAFLLIVNVTTQFWSEQMIKSKAPTIDTFHALQPINIYYNSDEEIMSLGHAMPSRCGGMSNLSHQIRMAAADEMPRHNGSHRSTLRDGGFESCRSGSTGLFEESPRRLPSVQPTLYDCLMLGEPPLSLNDNDHNRKSGESLASGERMTASSVNCVSSSFATRDFHIDDPSIVYCTDDEMERAYDRDTWRMFNRINAARSHLPDKANMLNVPHSQRDSSTLMPLYSLDNIPPFHHSLTPECLSEGEHGADDSETIFDLEL
jgi:hypothetical protein